MVQEKAKLDRASSLRNASTSSQPPPRQAPAIDLFGDEPAQPQRPVTTEPAISVRPPPVKAPVAPPKQNKGGDSLLGLDFFGGTQSAPPVRPSSAASTTTPGVSGRSDLKQSILSLYASAPKPAQAPVQSSSQGFAGMTSPSVQSPAAGNGQSFGGMDDAFSSLSFSSPAPQQQAAKPAPFSNFASPALSTKQPSSNSSGFPSGGSFFDSKPAPAPTRTNPPPPKPQAQPTSAGFGDFGDFTSAAPSQAPSKVKSPPAPVASSMGDLFDLSGPAPAPISTPAPKPAAAPKQPAPISASAYSQNSAFNLSSPAPTPAVQPQPAVSSGGFGNLSNMDAWGSNDAWSTPDPEPAKPAPAPAPIQTISSPTSTYKAPATTSMSAMSDDFGGWGSNTGSSAPPQQPTVTQDDDFGGWSSAEPVSAPTQNAQTTSSGNAQPKSFGGGDDLFGNVWE